MLRPALLLLLLPLSSPQDAPRMSPGLEAEIRSALEEIGLSEADLGYRPRTWWATFPRARELPFLLPWFEDLFAEPLAMPLYVRGMAEAVKTYLPTLPAEDRGKQPADRLRKLLYHLGVDPRISGFRPYSSNLTAEPGKQEPQLQALLELRKEAGLPVRLKSFGNEPDFPRPARELRAKLSVIPKPLRPPLARLLLNLLDARRWAKLAVRNLPAELRGRIRALRNLGETQGDGTVYFPEIEDAWARLDFRSLCYAAFKACDALETAEHELRTALPALPSGLLKALHFEWESPFGTILFSGTGNDEHELHRPFLVVDLGGDDLFEGPAGANRRDQLLSLSLDLGGRDTYRNEDPLRTAQGAGILGFGLLLDSGGDDLYENQGPGQGMGQLGIGMLMDRSGNDRRVARYSAQGAGFLGIGLCLDGGGNDSYRLFAEGQGFGCIGGIGALADLAGKDRYYAEPDAKIAGRGDYHSKGAIAVSNAQGVGSGRRGDGSDGHSYAGGLGMILDIGGDDHYRSGNWSLGTGYWFGAGFVWDGGGNDTFESCYFTQASGAHFAMGAIIDEKGNDVHELFGTAGAGLSFGWDFVNSLLLDVEGDDRYEARIISIACSEIRSNSFLFDLQGSDRYYLERGKNGMGWCDSRKDYEKLWILVPQNGLSRSIALLLDLGGGKDLFEGMGKDRKRIPTPGLVNGRDRKLVRVKERTHALFRDR